MVNEVKKTESNITGLFCELIGANIPSWKYLVAYSLVFLAMFFFFWESFVFSTIYTIVFIVLSICAYLSNNILFRLGGLILLYSFMFWLFEPLMFSVAMISVCLVRSFLHALSTSDDPTNQGGCHEA